MAREIIVRNWSRALRIDGAAVRELVRELGRATRTRADCSVVFIGDRRMRVYNRRYRGKKETTDVLSFPSDLEGYLGDIIICAPRLIAQARQAGTSVEQEVKLLITHGYLHLLGYDHETDDGRMRRLERRLKQRIRMRSVIRRRRQPSSVGLSR